MLFSFLLGCRHTRTKLGTRFKHTIFALSSGFGKCGVAVIRVSGPNARVALEKLCKRVPSPRRAQLKKIRDPETDEVLDHGLALWFPGPTSFTGEDCCELQVHGSSAVLKSIFCALGKLENFRPAEPGEFAKRAFYGGKLDLTSAEGLADLINAETEYQRKQAVIQMEGALCQLYTDWKNSLSKCLANIEAYIDFGEDQDIENTVMSDATSQIEALQFTIKNHLNDGRRGERLRSGVNMAIVGAPNVGKSSLLNFLSQKPSAIVSDVPGTTRDIVKVDLDISGFPVNVQDTAGLRTNTSDLIELEGINRAKKALAEAHLLVIVVDAQMIVVNSQRLNVQSALSNYLLSLGIPSIDKIVSEKSANAAQKFLIVANKIDLVQSRNPLLSLKEELGDELCLMSCVTNEGVEELTDRLSSHLRELCGDPSAENPSFSQPRHRFCLEETLTALTRFPSYSDVEIDLAAQEVRNALHSLGKIMGHVSTEEILDIIFKDFCIGK